MIIWSYHHIIIRSYYHIITLSYYHQITTPNGWSHFWCQITIFDTYWIFYPLSKEVSPKIRAVGAITFDDGSAIADQKFVAPPKRNFFEKKNRPLKFPEKKFVQKFFSVEKWKIANRLKRVLPKFRADPRFVRGVSGRSKFRSFAATFKIRIFVIFFNEIGVL